MRRLPWLATLLALMISAVPGRVAVRAQDGASGASLEVSFIPTDRAQVAVWVEREDGQFMGTVALTYAVAKAGIGNRPGALQMNSGYRWPYGRREGVLPVWAHRRGNAPGAKQWKRVIFQNRGSEGFASRTSNDQSVDDYYCLSFQKTTTSRDALDAVTCASVFSSDKGRYITQSDVDRGYAEPYETAPGNGSMRSLELTSLYPPRRDVVRCGTPGCYDHVDVQSFAAHALEVMPELDAITQATPQGERPVRWVFPIPSSWPAGERYKLFIEVNVEGDYNPSFNAQAYPTPVTPTNRWDTWAATFGYAYRGQPSVVYAIPFTLEGESEAATTTPVGFGALQGEDGELHQMDGSITDDADGAPGSGADRLRLRDGVRATMRVYLSDPCARDDAPPQCGMPCDDCGNLVCDPNTNTCQSYCVAMPRPGAVEDLDVSRHPERNKAHMWARLSFRVPESKRPISAYDIKVRAEGADWDQAFTHDSNQELLPVALNVCADPADPMVNRCLGMAPGTKIEVDLANLKQSTHYTVSVAPRDDRCHELGAVALAEFTTPSRAFTTVSPCFIASAAYGSPLASEIGILRGVRDRYLAPHALGRAVIRGYYAIGPSLAVWVREHTWLRDATRAMLDPLVRFARWWMS